MQSIDSHTLKAIKRDNISIEDYQELQKRFTEDGITTYTEFILGMPGDTYDSFSKGVSDVISSGQHNRIQFNNLSILPNAEMANSDYINKYKIKTVYTPIVNPHGSLDENPKDGIKENQELVISTKYLTTEDWIKTRLYASVSEFFYFNKVLQIPIMFKTLLQEISYKKIFEDLINLEDNNAFPIISKIIKSLKSHAHSITKGGYEFILDKNTLGIFWPPGELEYIRLLKENNFNDFYKESLKFFSDTKNNETKEILKECITINKEMMRMPFETEDKLLISQYNILDVYNSVKQNKKIEIKKEYSKIKIIKSDHTFQSWDDWAREVVWYGHRSGKYSCKIEKIDNSYEKKIIKSEKASNVIGNSYII